MRELEIKWLTGTPWVEMFLPPHTSINWQIIWSIEITWIGLVNVYDTTTTAVGENNLIDC